MPSVDDKRLLEEFLSDSGTGGLPYALKMVADKFGNHAVFSTSFGLEDQVIGHSIFSTHLPIRVFTLDTGRLFPETYSTWSRTCEKYSASIEVFYPDTSSIQSYVSTHGPNAFYSSVSLRKSCCQLRKVEPLQRALRGSKLWITGIRSAHSANRTKMDQIEWDDMHQLWKIHPLLNWSDQDVRDYIATNEVPYNILHDKGFVSIGCAPCTRAIRPGEDFRAGRWWWEASDGKECGLHRTSSESPELS
jgi:phosphoadenosine phosphosulfate reductase